MYTSTTPVWLPRLFYSDQSNQMFRLMKKQLSVIADVLLWWWLHSTHKPVSVGWLHGSKHEFAPCCFFCLRIVAQFFNMMQLGSGKHTNSSPRKQAPTEVPSAPSPVRPGALLRHWLGPPSPRHSPPNGHSSRPSAPLTASFPVSPPPSQQKEGEM